MNRQVAKSAKRWRSTIALRLWGGVMLILAGLLTFRCSQAVVMSADRSLSVAWESDMAEAHRAPAGADEWERGYAKTRFRDEVVRPIYRPFVDMYRADMALAILMIAVSGVVILWLSHPRRVNETDRTG